jgi:acetyl esterase
VPVDPLIQPILDAMNAAPPADPSLSVAERRAMADAAAEEHFTALSEPGPEVESVTDHRVPVDGGEITVRVLVPHGTAPWPAHVNFHGGGWYMGTLKLDEPTMRWIAAEVGCVVASVDYRLAPEHKYPTAAEDCYAALRWTVDHAGELGIDPSRVSVGGGSAGGNLAAAVALMARDRGGPRLRFQLLDIPATDLTLGQPSIDENGEGYMLTRASMEEMVLGYLGDRSRATEPYASPLLAADVSGLPPALIMTCEFDPLRDDGAAYGRRLEEAGVPVTVRCWPGMFHGAGALTAILPAARDYRTTIIEALRGALCG